MEKYFTRMGDGSAVQLSAGEIKEELQSGTHDAADRGKIPELESDELDYLFEIVTSPVNVTSVTRGKEIVTSSDSGAFKINYQANISRTGRSCCRLVRSKKPGPPRKRRLSMPLKIWSTLPEGCMQPEQTVLISIPAVPQVMQIFWRRF